MDLKQVLDLTPRTLRALVKTNTKEDGEDEEDIAGDVEQSKQIFDLFDKVWMIDTGNRT